MTLNHLLFSATESTFSLKIQNTNIIMQGKVLRGHLYLLIRIKANSSFPSSPWIVLLMLMGFISASRRRQVNDFSIHMLQFTQYLLWHVGQLNLWSPGPVFISVLDSNVLWADTPLGTFHLSNEKQVRRNEVSEDTWKSLSGENIKKKWVINAYIFLSCIF